MKTPAALLLSVFLIMVCAAPAFAAAPQATPAGIPLNAPWKVKIYALAHTKFLHPAWGWQHSERNYPWM